jgi:hypothetical protein
VREALQEIEADDQPGIRLPLRTHGLAPFRDIDTFQHLRDLLRTDAQARARLGDPARARRLRDDLARPLGAPADPSSGFVGRKVHLQTAIRTVGYTHVHGGRPLPGTILEDRASAIALVQAKLTMHPWTRSHPFTDDEVGHELDRVYFVEPWPFGALLLD